ncbi:MAG: VOC family protein [Gammaproteobacteria bacterium]|nr:VOC family protein [Gammaproteobacteria bacterium]
MDNKICFHLAFPCHDFTAAKKFYVEGLGFQVGRESEHAMILNIGENQVVAHGADTCPELPEAIYPRHFGLIFKTLKEYETLLTRAKKHSLKFYREESMRFPGKMTEHHSFFLVDPSNNLLEFKYYAHAEAIFGARDSHQVGESN